MTNTILKLHILLHVNFGFVVLWKLKLWFSGICHCVLWHIPRRSRDSGIVYARWAQNWLDGCHVGWVPWRHLDTLTTVTLPTFVLIPSPTLECGPRSPSPSLGASQAFCSSTWKNQQSKVSFSFFFSSLPIRLSRTLHLNIRQCMRSWPNPWPPFSSLLLTSLPATSFWR